MNHPSARAARTSRPSELFPPTAYVLAAWAPWHSEHFAQPVPQIFSPSLWELAWAIAVFTHPVARRGLLSDAQVVTLTHFRIRSPTWAGFSHPL